MLRRISTVLIAVGICLFSSATAHATDSGYLDEATQALQSSYVYVSPLVSGIDAATLSTLEQECATDDIAIVVLPASAQADIGSTGQFLKDIALRTSHDTIVVAVGSDLEAGSNVLPSGEASQIANSAEANNSSVASSLLEFVSGVEGVQIEASKPAPEPGPNVLGGVGAVLGVIVLVGVLGYGVSKMPGAIRRFRQNQENKSVATDTVQGLLRKIGNLQSSLSDRDVKADLSNAANDTEMLFKRLKKYNSDRFQEISGRYEVLLAVVLQTLEKYIDIQDNARYYPNFKENLAAGKSAVHEFAEGVLKNTQEVINGTLTEFEVNEVILKATNTKKDPKIS